MRFGMLAELIVRGSVQAFQKAAGKLPRLKVRLGVGEDVGISHVQHFGFASRPPKGSRVIVASVGAERADAVAIGTVHGDYLVELDDDGDACIHDTRGNVVKLTADGIKLTSPTKVLIDCADVRVAGDTGLDPIPLGSELLTWLNTHTHPGHGAVASTAATTDILSSKAKVAP